MNPNSYIKQQERALKRKIELIEYKGGKCEKCGYNKNFTALEFHHVNPNEKEFQLDSRHLSNTNIEKLKDEVDKCILLCSNCHREIHHPEYDESNIEDMLKTYSSRIVKILERKRRMAVCPVCGEEFEYYKGKIYCSKECREKDKHYPPKEEVLKKYQELKSQEKVAKYYGLTRKIIIGILKKQ